MFRLTDEQRALQQRARALARGAIAERAAEVDRTEAYPWANVDLLKEAGFLGMTIPRAHGGRGASYLDAVLVIDEVARCCGVSARIVVEANMGAIGAIMAYGSEAQKAHAAALVLGGDKPAICITEPGAGSAASEMRTTAVKHGDRYVINGTKHWITGGGVSRLHLIFARVEEAGRFLGIGAFIAVRGEDVGLRIGRREPAMGLRGIPETEIHFEDLELGSERALLAPAALAHGFARLMNAYNGQRVGAASVALGLAEGAFECARGHAREREQFGRPIAEFQGLQWMFADMRVALDAARLMVYHAAEGAGTAGFPDPLEAAEAKLLAAETAIRVTNDALQVHGAMGYSRRLPLERMARDARMFSIGGGTAQMLRNLIGARTLGIRAPQTRDGYLRLAEREQG